MKCGKPAWGKEKAETDHAEGPAELVWVLWGKKRIGREIGDVDPKEEGAGDLR